jgi:ABC-type transport system involved in multi-copper enzyme maturation permease subunit
MTPSATKQQLWIRQILALARYEIGRTLFRRRSAPAYVLVGLPMLLGILVVILGDDELGESIASAGRIFAGTFHFFILRFVIFFGCAGLFINLFRGEILDRSLHFLLLAPIRRELLVAGKYLGGLAASVALFVPATLFTMVTFHLPNGVGPAAGHLLAGPGLSQVLSYTLIVTLACVGYGAVFLLAGLFFKNPMIPAGLFLGWELLTPFMPKALKAISIVHYLVSLEPIPVDEGPIAILTSPVAPFLAVLALLVVSAGMVAAAAWKARRMEISYSVD